MDTKEKAAEVSPVLSPSPEGFRIPYNAKKFMPAVILTSVLVLITYIGLHHFFMITINFIFYMKKLFQRPNSFSYYVEFKKREKRAKKEKVLFVKNTFSF